MGIQTFSEIIEENYLYVDKTESVLKLLNAGKYIFLARPRRFGKSLLISVLENIFKGRKDLFAGLYIEDKIPWKQSPVIRLDFSGINYSGGRQLFESSFLQLLKELAEAESIHLESIDFKSGFRELISKMSRNGKAVILIDEYDKPVLDHLTDSKTAKENRDLLSDFFSVLKYSDEHIKYFFITGVSKFSHVSIFSGLNNIKDITMNREFSSLTGYTEEELKKFFSDRMESLSKKMNISSESLLNQIRTWYNGYSWDGNIRVFNPFSILRFFDEGEFHNFWFESGTPDFLIQYIKKEKISVPSIEGCEISPEDFGAFTPESIDFHSLLFQTGYLTINEQIISGHSKRFRLDYPNEEVKNAFLISVMKSFLEDSFSVSRIRPTVEDMFSALADGRVEDFILRIRSLFASIPYNLHIHAEAYYHSLFYMILKLIGCSVSVEVLSSEGRADGILEIADTVYVIEMKMDSPKKAIEQIYKRKYYEPYLGTGKNVFLLGLGYAERNLSFLLEKLQ